MSATKQPEQSNEIKRQAADALISVIAEQVIHSLGMPAAPHRVQVRSLWGHFFRVNILIGEDATRMKVAHSYFLKTDGEGRIVASTPKIIKQN